MTEAFDPDQFEPLIRSAPSGVFASLAMEQPDGEANSLLRELLRELDEGELRESLLTLNGHRHQIGQGFPLIEKLVDAIVSASLGGKEGELPIEDHTRRLLYVLRVESSFAPGAAPAADAMTTEDVRMQARVALRQLLEAEPGRDQIEAGAKQLLSRGLLDLIWRQAAQATIQRGGNFFIERWLKPDGLDYFLDLTYGSLKEMPRVSEDDLVFAFAGFPHLVAEDSDCEQLRTRIGVEAVLPRLIHRRWPEAAEVFIEEVGRDETLATGGRAVILASLLKLRGDAPESAPQ